MIGGNVDVIEETSSSWFQHPKTLSHIAVPIPFPKVHEHDGAIDQIDRLIGDFLQPYRAELLQLAVVEALEPFGGIRQHVARDVSADPGGDALAQHLPHPSDAAANLDFRHVVFVNPYLTAGASRQMNCEPAAIDDE